MRHRITRCALLSMLLSSCSPKIEPKAKEPDAREVQALKELDQAKEKFQSGDYEAARLVLTHAETLAESAHSAVLRLNIAMWLGSVQMRQSHFEDALQYFEQQLPLIGPEDRTLRAKVLNNAAVCNYRLGELDTALSYYKQALAIDIETHDVAEQSICLGNMGNIYLDRGEYVKANRYFTEAARLSRNDEDNLARWFSNSARANIELKEWESAYQYNAKALEIKRRLKMRVSELYSLRNAALIAQGKGDSRASEALFLEVIHAESDDPAPALESQAGLAKLYAFTGRLQKAEAQFENALTLLDQTRARLVKDEYKMSYVDSLMMFHQDYVDFLMSQGRKERALEVAEASRARILCERLHVNTGAQKFTAAQYRRLAKSTGSVFVSYWTAPQRSYGWVITGDEILSFALPSKARLASLVDAYRALIENLHDPLEVEDAAGSQLYTALVEPIAHRLSKSSRVIVIPDGPLAALNFETLPVGARPTHYLIEDVTISIAPSLNLLAGSDEHSQKRARISKSLLMIGDPDSTDKRFPRLPYASAEMDNVARHFQKDSMTQLRGAKAIAAGYRNAAAQAFSYVHFTAHAIADREHPLDSAILLSGPTDDGKLTASAVMQQSLHAELVTLSACRTAGARTYAGEGLVGFTWAFFLAGARSVIAGLWDVSDESTPMLMDQLYAGISMDQDPAEALRAAKLALIHSGKTYRLPYYWGPFQLYVRQVPR